MASSIIHIAISKNVNEKLKRDESRLFIGSIAPDIAKLIGETKVKSHFITDEDDIPNLDLFLSKYKNYLNDDFVMGYYLHLLEDYLWFKYFITEIINEDKNLVKSLDGKTIKLNKDEIIEYVYNDYTNLNISLIDYYNIDLKIFYNEIPKLENIIEEIPMDKINIIVNKVGIIIKNSKDHKKYLFNLKQINKFIDLATKLILNNLYEMKIIK